MADITGAAYAVIFVGVLLLVGIVVYGTVADPMGDQPNYLEEVIVAGCTNESTTSFNSTSCRGTLDNAPMENVTRPTALVYNCTTVGVCTAITAPGYNLTDDSVGTLHILDDQYNGSIRVTYYEDTALANADNAQQSITSIGYSGFEVATIMVIVMAAVGIVSGIFLIGRRGA